MITYNVDQTVNTDVVKNNYIEAGIIENVELKGIRYGVSEKGNEFIEYTFVDENKAELKHTEYKPKGDTEEKTVERTIKQIKRIKQVICGYDDKNPATMTFVDPKDYIIRANDFKTFAEETIRLLGNKNVGKKVRIKAVYNDNGFVTLPKYSTYAFIEPMSIPKEKSIIKVLSIDLMKRPEKQQPTGQPSIDVFNTVADAVRPTASTDDLPF